MKRALLAGALFALAACAPSAADSPIPEQWQALELSVERVSLGAETVGRLRFRGGLELSSSQETFGGFSGLEVLDEDRLLAVSDNGLWFEARLDLGEDGTLVGLADARVALMRDEDGQPLDGKEAADAEGLTHLPDGRFAVSFEQTQTIRIYDINRDGPFGAARAGPRLAGVARLPRNSGLEAIAAGEDGALLVGAEGGDGVAPLWRIALDAGEPAAPRIGYALRAGYSLTGMDRAPDGAFVALERFYAPVIGARARITRFPAAALNARGESLREVAELALLAPPLAIDNFEAIATTRSVDGTTRLYILSDDNFSDRQRTLLLAFDIIEEITD
jgi:hypothetical protein